MLSWNDADLARDRQQEILRNAERDRLADAVSRSGGALRLRPRLGAQLFLIAAVAGALAFVLR
jgi:hypothetical protein